MSKTIVFVHGAWLTSLSWESFLPYFEEKGFTCLAPEWPLRDKPIDELRANPPAELAEIGVVELTDHFEAIIRALPEPPIIIGHSFGGLITQKLLDRGVGSAGVALDSVAPEGVFGFYPSVLRANTGVFFKWMAWQQVLQMSFRDFQYAFSNTFPEEQQRYFYSRYVVPETGRIFFQAALAQVDPHHAIHVNFKNNSRAPLLLISGEKDHLIPTPVTKSNYEHYEHSTARTDFMAFADRPHLIVAGPGWQEVADYIYTWLVELPQG